MAILFQTDSGNVEGWLAELARRLPDDDVRVWPDTGDRSDIEFIIMWNVPMAELATFPNLRAILLNGSGGNHLRPVDALPDVPVVRLVDQELAADMARYALSWIIHLHRGFHIYAEQQRQGRWARVEQRPTSEYEVGVLGLGNVGARLAGLVADVGYRVRGWSRTPKAIAGVEVHTGPDELDAALDGVECLVNVLPLTVETRKLLNAERWGRLAPGAGFVNIGRGGTVDDDDLFAALDSGHLTAAVLDVFRGEPLPPTSPMWHQPGVIVTPHCSGWANPATSVDYMADNIERIRRGESPFPLFDRNRGY